ncbi:hypothetical protein FAES_3965 [Fibrella aestuarina BUZ 2]|uniref:Uracil-DNA glycosylase-like domain-containing protein n=1 Tax=Fibrella aestuarina BUZ 2 TaxID=1166018 RepID=I0KCW3_9BACT|nr:hypothetical protein [Fibrella aestuarina]CCH01966.1 hypothetical protein FAES_3965 [Fibrella aestuarina BUZ 2]
MNDDSIFSRFGQLYKENSLIDCDQFLIKDGIIDPALYPCQPRRILVIAKEHNFLHRNKQPNGYEGDYRAWWKMQVEHRFAHRISEWCFGVLNGFTTPFEEVTHEQKQLALRSIAFMNVKKTGGGHASNPQTILDYIDVSRALLLEQIQQIAPDLIIGGFRHDVYMERLFGVAMTPALSDGYSTGSWQGCQLITSFHPSARKSKRFLYTKLAETMRTLAS